MSKPVRLAVVGAGLIGRRHADHIAAEPGARLGAIVDPSAAGRNEAERLGARWLPTLGDLLETDRPDGIVIATPNATHLSLALQAIAAGVPSLVEKPLATTTLEGEQLVAAAEQADVPLLVGHHRRHNPMVVKAKEIIESGRLGRVLTLHGMVWLMKPDSYFDVAWRREATAGPVLLNLIHDIDLFRHFCGQIVSAQAFSASNVRGFEAEETAAVILRFESGALGTVNVSDSVVAPWSWELTTGENPAFPRQGESCYQIAGTHGALAIPQLDVWSHPGRRSWWEPLARERVPFTPDDPLRRQISQFCAVIRGEEPPLVSGRDGLEALRVVEAVRHSALTGRPAEVGAE